MFGRYISDEANEAAKVKQSYPVMVILGNPPYSGHSANKGQWITNLLHGKDSQTGHSTENYFEVDGKGLGERNPKWLNDDYVKFIRFAQWKIDQTGYGVLAFITNHGYLDNPTFRGMRQSLMQSFDDIYVLDLHGNAKKKERTPDGSKDENVFDIQQGVAIGIFVKRQKRENLLRTASVHHAHLWGSREVYEKVGEKRWLVGGKYHWLAAHDVRTTEWTKLDPTKPFYLFAPQNAHLKEEYESGKKITEMMLINVLGFQTHRDHFAIDFSRESLYSRIAEMRSTLISDQDYAKKYRLTDNRDWKLSNARKYLRADSEWENKLITCMYRPFDRRFCYFSEVAMDYPRRELMRHVAKKENYCLLVPRQLAAIGWRHVGVSSDVAESCLVSTKTKEQNYNFPLYLYPDSKQTGLFVENSPTNTTGGRRHNFAPTFVKDFAGKLKMSFINDGKGDLRQTFGPEDIFSYLYAVLHSRTYRERYAEFLKIDFPRLPLTSDPNLFSALCILGERLVGLHLMEKIGKITARFPEPGNNLVEKIDYTCPTSEPEKSRVWINKTQYFEGVSPEVWEFHIGGYQVCQKWLKDRKGYTLIFSDIQHYQRIVAALAETINLMEQIDDVIEDHGGWPIQ